MRPRWVLIRIFRARNKADDHLENKMTISPDFSSIIKAESQQGWESALQEVEKIGICGLKLLTTGQYPLSHEIRLEGFEKLIYGKVYILLTL